MLTDALTHAVSPITVPAVGGSYLDPAFGTSIKRVSDAANITTVDGGRVPPGVGIEYSGMSAFNSNDTAILIACFSVFEIRTLPDLRRVQLPLEINTGSEPRWDRDEPNKFYYHNKNVLFSFDWTTLKSTPVQVFAEYNVVGFGGGESDISSDDNYLVMDGNNGAQIFTYNLATRTKGSVLLVPAGSILDAAILTPSNRVIVSWKNTEGPNRFQGEELYDKDMRFLRQILPFDTHKTVSRDPDGGECMVTSPDTPGIEKINLDTSKVTSLLVIGYHWPYIAGHIAATMDETDPSVFVCTYDNGDGTKVVYPYQNEIFQVFLSGKKSPVRWAHNRANPSSPYENQPQISVSRRGSKIGFMSNMGGRNDVYTFNIPIAVPVTLPPAQTATLTTSRGDRVEVTVKQVG